MASQSQIEANRRNAQKSTGANTPSGKAVTSQNALKTGIDAKSEVIRCESRADYEALIAEYYERFTPTAPEERCLVDMLIKSEWLGRRYISVETAIWERKFVDTESRSLGGVFLGASDTFSRVDRRINSAQRNFDKALVRLQAVQAKRAPAPEISNHHPADPLPPSPPETTNPDLPSCDPTQALPSAEMAASDIANEQVNPQLAQFLISTDPAPIAPPQPSRLPDLIHFGEHLASVTSLPNLESAPVTAPHPPESN